ncbi:MAG: thioredoxin family protein [Chloroflexota bacterium]|nr:thioredoxin family protein [Chloroflexota bacterium]
MAGAEAVRRWVAAAGATFPTVVDGENRLAQLFDYKVVPNGIFLDETGVIRYRKVGGFSVANADDVDAIQRLIDGRADVIETSGSAVPDHLRATERELVETRTRLGAELFRRGAKGEAIAEWMAALRRDPENFTIRKQIWMAEHPERFQPTIDFGWQQEQLAREREAEIAAGVCGPDGCPLPQAAQR